MRIKILGCSKTAEVLAENCYVIFIRRKSFLLQESLKLQQTYEKLLNLKFFYQKLLFKVSRFEKIWFALTLYIKIIYAQKLRIRYTTPKVTLRGQTGQLISAQFGWYFRSLESRDTSLSMTKL